MHPVTSRLIGIIIADCSIVIGPDTSDTLADAPAIGAALLEAPGQRTRHRRLWPAPSSHARHDRTQTPLEGTDEHQYIFRCMNRSIYSPTAKKKCRVFGPFGGINGAGRGRREAIP